MTEPQIHLTSLLQQQDWLRRLARSLVEDAAADDLVQDTNRAALEGDPPRASEPKRLRGWLRVIATRRAAETWRQDAGRASREREAGREGAFELPDVGQELERAELKRFLTDAVMQLDEPLRDAVVLRYYEGRSYGQIAGRLGITEVLARKRASRACAALRERLDQHSGGDRSVWVSALAPWVGSAPSWSVPGMMVLVAVAAVVLVLGALWWQPFAPSIARVEAVGHVETPSEVELVEITLDTPEENVGAVAERRQAQETAVSGSVPVRSRIAFPLPPVNERATLDVLAVWDDTDEPAPFVELFAFGTQTRSTDASGRVRFSNLAAGHGGVGNFTGSHLNLLPKLEPGEVRSITFRMERHFSVAGRVVDASGNPVKDAEVQLSASSNGSSVTVAHSDAAGRFVLDGLSGGLTLSAAHPLVGVSTCQLVNQYRISQRTESDGELELVLAGGTGSLSGIVIDEDGVPVHGAQVQFAPELPPSAAEGERVTRTGAITDEKGRFEMRLIRPGPGTWSVRTSFHGVNAGEVSIVKGVTTEVTLQLSPGLVVRGRVLDEATGKPVVKAIVGIGERGESTVRAAWTDESGAFEIEQVQAARARLWVEVLRDTVYEQPFVPGTTDASDLVLRISPQTQAVDGRVIDDEGAPVVGCSVRAVGDRSSSFSAQTGKLGKFRIEHAPLDASALEVHPPEPDDDRLLVRVTGCLPRVTPIDVVVPVAKLASGSVVGRVLSPEGVAIVGFDAELEAMDGSAWLFTDGQESGLFRLNGVSVGRHALVIRAGGHVEYLAMLDVKAGEALDLGSITLEPGVTFRLDAAFDVPPEDGTVELYEIRREDQGVEQRLYLGDVQAGLAEYGPVPAGPTRLVFDRAGFHRVLELRVEPDGQTLEAIRFGRPSTTSVRVEYPAVTPRGADGLEGDVMSFELSWSLRNAAGQVVQTSYRPRSQVYGRALKLHGLDPDAEFTLEARDIEGRSGSVRFRGAGDPVLLMRR